MVTCLVCQSLDVDLVLDLGTTAPANNFLKPQEIGTVGETQFPLRVGLCRTCGHVQLMQMVEPSILFDHYLYMSSASSTLTDHLHGLAARVVKQAGLSSEALVVDVGCNDGTLLEGFKKAGVQKRVGIDPAANLATTARKRGAEVVTGYFSESLASRIRESYGRASVITLTNTFPHIPDLAGLMRAVDQLLEDNGLVVLEAHYLQDLLDLCAFDTVYHEHVSYWALRPMQELMARHGFEVVDVERLPIHHGQLRAWIARAGKRSISEAVTNLAASEAANGLQTLEPYRALSQRIGTIKQDLLDLIATTRAAGGQVVGYGAPAKGSTLLSFFGLGPDDLDYIADRNPLKQGRVTPGTHIPIVAPERIFADQPALIVLFAWNFAEEIGEQLRPYLERGGRIVVPIPSLTDVAVAA